METAVQTSPEKNIKNVFSIENITHYLVFLFPLGAVSVKSWTSLFTVMLFFTSLTWLFKKSADRRRLITKQESVLLWLFAAFFFVFLISQTVNGWQGVKSHWVGIELRYLFFIPIYMLLRRYPDSAVFFIKGCIVSGFILAFNAIYDVTVLGRPMATGAYHHLYYGSVAAIYILVIIYSDVKKLGSKAWLVFAVLSVAMCLYALIMTTARGSFIAVIPLLMAYPFLMKKIKLRYAVAMTVLFLTSLIVMYSGFDVVKNRVDIGVNEFTHYFNTENHYDTNFKDLGSVGIRFEYWKAALIIAKENPVLGVGRTGYVKETRKLIDEHKISRGAKDVTDPHNAFFNTLVTKGSVGLAVFLAMFVWSFYLAFKQYKVRRSESRLAMVFLVAIFIISLTDSASFNRGHFLSFVLFGWLMLMAWANQSVRNDSESTGL